MTDLYGVLTAPADSAEVTGWSVRFERDYDADVEELWQAVTDPERLARWYAPVRGQLRPGGTVRVEFDDGTATYEVESCAAPHRLVFRWLHAEGHSTVTATLDGLGAGRSRLVLVHDGLAARPAPLYSGGWHWHLDGLGEQFAPAERDRAGWEDLADHYVRVGARLAAPPPEVPPDA